MKKRFVRALALAMAAVTVAGAATGCGGDGQGGTHGNSDVAVENNCYETGFPIAKDTVKLTVMVKDDSNGAGHDMDKVAITQWMKDEMNVEIEWLVVPGGMEVNQQATLAFSSGNMPDILMGMAPLGYEFYWDYILEGKVQDLTPYVKKYGSNIRKMFKDFPQAEYLSTGYDGNLYMLPVVRSYENDPGRLAGALYINQTWLDNLGLAMPTTTAEFKNVLRQFKDNDPNGNGIKDEIPLDLQEDLPTGLYGAFGIPVYKDLWYLDDSGQVHFAPVEDGYRRALTYYRDLYQEGLVGKDFYNQSITDIMKKIDGPVSTVGCFVTDGVTNMLSAERAEEYVVVPPLSDEQGDCTWTNQEVESMWPEWFVVTSSCKYPEIAVRLADYFYSTEGSYTALYGPQGKDNLWYYNEDGKVVFTDSANKETKKYEFTPSYSLPHYRSEEFYAAAYEETDESKLTPAERIDKRNKEAQIELYFPVMPKNSLPKAKMSLANMKKWKTTSQDIDDYTWRKNFLMGEASLENEWDSYIANLKKLGVDDLIQIKQESYDEYIKWLNE